MERTASIMMPIADRLKLKKQGSTEDLLAQFSVVFDALIRVLVSR